ncbi:MAG TPA: aldo/keto reductase [Bacteroidales bacterium]|nr:L-fucose dehydrogenase [Bacteroidales bacterium]HOU95969.1 aldo/keto reductase [Bacteroidales bacterium]HQG36524.1 aldo/keto reductase [Bacteroidales bacterium]HQG53014.1 aldo/keto reductase [Bacteroidales bacterium]HQJ20636.1 aldo/keto reductase [Bacteroidales bacterium]
MKKSGLLGETGLVCPPIIYGTSYLGNLYRELSEKEKINLIREWFNVTSGNVMIDSAGKYGAGLALEMIGKGLEKLNIQPERVTISNKLGWYRIPLETNEPTFEPGIWANLKYNAIQKISYMGILECWEQGNKLLGGKYKPAMVSVHDPDEYLNVAKDEKDRDKRLNDILEAYQALFELKEKGEVKAVGIGSKDWMVIKELYQKVKFDWVMFANKFTIYHHPKEIMDFMEQLDNNGVGIINSAVFNAGFLTGGEYFDYRKADPNNPADRHLFVWREKFFSVCDKFHIHPADACIQFALSPPQICAIALNTSNPDRISENHLALEKEIPKKFWQALKDKKIINPDYPYL